MFVSVIIPTSGRLSLKESIKSIMRQQYPSFEIIVVGINKKIKDYIPKSENIRFFVSRKANASLQKNIGIKNAKGEIVAFIDDDAVARKGWLSSLMKHYDDKDVVCVGGKVELKFPGKVPQMLRRLPPEMFKGFLGGTLLEYKKPSIINKALLWGTNISFRKSVLLDIGCFDEKLGRGLRNLISEEERKVQMILLAKGYKLVYEPKAIVEHLVPENRLNESYFLRRSFWQGYSEVLRVSDSQNFQELLKVSDFEGMLLHHISEQKMLELCLELIDSGLKKKIDMARSLGRIAAYLTLKG